jgi:hypothetical protein
VHGDRASGSLLGGHKVHELFELTEHPPVAPGASPFHVRGFYYTRLLEHAKSLPGGREAFIEGIADERVREYLRQKFVWSKWYDALPTLPCHITLARLRGEDFELLTKARGRLASRSVIPSMFRAVLAMATPKAMAQHIPSLMMSNFDFMRSTVTHVGETEGHGRASAMPLVIAPSMTNIILGFIEGALELAKYDGIESRYSDVALDGDVQGFPTVSVTWEFSWAPKRRR